MNNNLTDITVVMDRSGSMSSCQEQAQSGLNKFVDEQKKHPGDALFTLVQFDNEYEFVHKGIPVDQVPHLSLVPRGSTALLDAVGRAIAETGERLSAMPEPSRPGLVVFVIVTDGQENSSKEFRLEKVRSMIEEQTTKYGWQFTFLGADPRSFADARAMGIQGQAVAQYTSGKEDQMYGAAASNVVRMRSARAGGQSVKNAYTEEELKAMSGKE